jgi:prepilin-type N-terminal cleavage/methylation domain-containing protein
VSRHGVWEEERGFTLIEVISTIVVMGVLVAIASSTWFGLVEDRRVDSATNQMVSELHFAHTSATNRLEDWKVDLQPNSRTYRIGACTDQGVCAAPLSSASERSLEERTQIRPSGGGMVQRVVFEPNGDAQITGAGRIRIAAEDGSPCHEIEVNEATSTVRVTTNVC